MKNTFFKKYFQKRRGSTIATSLVIISSVSIISLGAISIASENYKTTKQIEQANVAYFLAETGLEYAMFDIAGHLPGYEIDNDQITIQTRIYAINDNGSGSITIPASGTGSDESNDDWNTLNTYSAASIPLYVDNSHLYTQ